MARRDQLEPGVQAALVEYRSQVGLDGVRRDVELLGDFLVAQPAQDQARESKHDGEQNFPHHSTPFCHRSGLSRTAGDIEDRLHTLLRLILL